MVNSAVHAYQRQNLSMPSPLCCPSAQNFSHNAKSIRNFTFSAMGGVYLRSRLFLAKLVVTFKIFNTVGRGLCEVFHRSRRFGGVFFFNFLWI